MRDRSSRLTVIGLVAASALISAACSPGSGGDKAGGPGEPTVLTFANTDGGLNYRPALGYFVQRVSERSAGSLRIDVVPNWPGSEQQVVADVALGKADLTAVGTATFESLGTSFLALIAPMLIDSYTVQDAVLTSDIPAQILQQTTNIGATGVAILPGGGLVKPIAVARRLLGPADWRGMVIETSGSQAQARVIRALGALPTDSSSPALDEGLQNGQIQGFAKSLLVYGINDSEHLAPNVTANVNLWPGLQVLLGNPASLARLSGQQRDWVHQAAADAIAHLTAPVDRDTQTVSEICQAGARLVNASDADLTALRQAFEPVYAELEQDAQTKSIIEQIARLKTSTTAEPSIAIPVGCSGVASSGAATDPLAGTWATAKITQSEWVKAFIAAGFSEKDAHEYAPVSGAEQYDQETLTFDHGHFTESETADGHDPVVGNEGTYKVGPEGTFDLITAGVETYAYVVTGDRLTLHLVKVVCSGDCGPPIGPTLYGSFPFTKVQ
jgi:TRAP-type transport system periplasmic protein